MRRGVMCRCGASRGPPQGPGAGDGCERRQCALSGRSSAPSWAPCSASRRGRDRVRRVYRYAHGKFDIGFAAGSSSGQRRSTAPGGGKPERVITHTWTSRWTVRYGRRGANLVTAARAHHPADCRRPRIGSAEGRCEHVCNSARPFAFHRRRFSVRSGVSASATRTGSRDRNENQIDENATMKRERRLHVRHDAHGGLRSMRRRATVRRMMSAERRSPSWRPRRHERPSSGKSRCA